MLREAKITGLIFDPDANAPRITLKTGEGEEVPIWIGMPEASSIALALRKTSLERPITHDLFKNFMVLLGIHVSRVDVCSIRDGTYYAEIHFASNDSTFTMDARPSDAIALAVRFDAPLYVDDTIITEVLDKSEDGAKWAEYLKNLNPEDFGEFEV